MREFPSFTVDLNTAIADWLKACGVDTVAMESTGVYWIPLYELLESRRITVLLVNARHVKNVSGRKSDVLDCQPHPAAHDLRLAQRGVPPSRPNLCVALALAPAWDAAAQPRTPCPAYAEGHRPQVNVQLANVISDVVGETGQKILRDIVAGERDGQVLGAMKNARIHASVDEIAKSLQGNWRAEHLFALKQALNAFDFIGTQLMECDREMEQQLQCLQVHEGEPAKVKQRGRTSQFAEVRSAHAAIQDVRRGFDAH